MVSSKAFYPPFGMTLITPVTLLLALAFTSAMLTSLALMTQSNIQTAAQRLSEARVLAQNQLNIIKAKLVVSPDWQQSLTEAEQDSVVATQATLINGADVQWFTLQSEAIKDGTTARITESVIRFPVLMNLPVAAVMYQGELNTELAFTLVVPQIPGGGTAYSIWSDEAVSFNHPERVSCLQSVWEQGECFIQPLSGTGNIDQDVVGASAIFPSDLLHYLFNLEGESPDFLAQLTSHRYDNCSSLPLSISGIIWIHGDCRIPAGITIGSSVQPVLLITKNAELILEDGALIVGLSLNLCENSAFSFPVEMADSANISGALVSNCHFTSSSSLQVNYRPEVLSALQRLPNMQRLQRIPGSWRDF